VSKCGKCLLRYLGEEVSFIRGKDARILEDPVEIDHVQSEERWEVLRIQEVARPAVLISDKTTRYYFVKRERKKGGKILPAQFEKEKLWRTRCTGSSAKGTRQKFLVLGRGREGEKGRETLRGPLLHRTRNIRNMKEEKNVVLTREKGDHSSEIVGGKLYPLQ